MPKYLLPPVQCEDVLLCSVLCHVKLNIVGFRDFGHLKMLSALELWENEGHFCFFLTFYRQNNQ